MFEDEVLRLQIVGTVRLLIASYLLFFWLPRKVFPQDYLDDPLDRTMFNIIHMAAIITVLFPLFVYLKVFGFPFLILFFIGLRILIIRYYERKNVREHFLSLYRTRLEMTLKILEKPRAYRRVLRMRFSRTVRRLISPVSPVRFLFGSITVALVFYSLCLLMYRGYISLVASVPDMYQFYYWNNILKINILFDRVAGAPYMWSGPVLVYTVYLLTRLNTIVLYNLFPLLNILFIFFSLFYFVEKSYGRNGWKTASPVLALALFGIVMLSPLAQHFLGTTVTTSRPEVLRLPFLSVYTGVGPGEAHEALFSYPFLLYWRLSTALPYELAAAFFLANLFFLMRFIESRSPVFLLLYAESLTIVFSLHGGVAIVLLPCSLLLVFYGVLHRDLDLKTMARWGGATLLAGILGNLWIVQFALYGLPRKIGAAAPVLDKFLGTKSAVLTPSADIYTVQILSMPPLLLLLALLSLILTVAGFVSVKKGLVPAASGLITTGVLLLYCAPNLGLPKFVDHSRLQIFVALSYAITFGTIYHLVFERAMLRPLLKQWCFTGSVVLVTGISVLVMARSPRWLDTKTFRESINDIEYNEAPYLVNRIEDQFQPFTYTVVSYVQSFPQVISKGYHMNTQDFLQEYQPAERILKIPTEFTFIFVEKSPKRYGGMGEYWYRWRRDIMLKLTDWVALYAAAHDNIRLWHDGQTLQVYVVDNRASQDAVRKQREAMMETER
jgi:hypothetical protein